jgi:hypothetical protein
MTTNAAGAGTDVCLIRTSPGRELSETDEAACLSQFRQTSVAFKSENMKRWNLSKHLRCYFAMGKIRGTSCMRRHIAAHRATTKYFSNSFVFKPKIEKEGLPRDSTADLGAGGLRFKSGRPDQTFQILSRALH